MRRVLSAAIASAAVVVASILVAPAAVAEVGDSSQSSAQFLSGSLLTGIDTSSVAGIDGAQASYVDGTNTTPVVDNAALDVTALSAIGLPSLPNNVTLGNLLNLGVVTQHAEADAAGVSSSNSGTADASLDLLPLTGGATNVLSAANLDLGAISSSASLTGATDVTRDYSIAQATLNLTSPAVAGITTTTTNATGTLVNALNGLATPIQNAVNSSVGTIINTIGGITGTASTNTTVTVNASRLNTAIQGVLTQPLSTNLVTIDPSTGRITVNLANGIDLNNLPPDSTLLSPQVMQQVSSDVATLLGQLQSNINNILNNATNYVDISLNSHTAITAPVIGTTLGTMDLTYNGTLGNFLAGAPITVAGTGVLAPATVLGTLSSIVETAVGTAVNTAITTAVNTAGQAVNTVVTNATNALAPALTGIADVAAVNLNVQTDNANGSYSETAVQVTLLGGAGATLNLATSTVGPNVRQAYTPTIAATDTSPGSPTTVTGGGWPPNTQVTLQVTDSNGNAVGNPITVTTDANGNIPDGTTYPIPAGSPTGQYTVTGTTAAGTTATGTFQVTDTTPPAAPVITTPADGSTITDRTPTITGTAEPNSTVTVSMDGTQIGTTTADANGNWSLPTTDPLADGSHTVSATATDAAGNTSAAASNTFTVDATPDAAPVITDPTSGTTTTDNSPTISGTGVSGDTVTVTDGAGTTLCTATVAADGTWTCTPATPLDDGTYTITATQTDPAGNVSDPSAPVTFTVDTTAPDAPVITGPADGSTISDTTPTITGTGESGATVTVTDENGNTLCTALVGDGGAWTCDSNAPLSDGSHTITATQTDEAGNTSDPSAPVTFTIDTTENAPVITDPVSGTSTNDTTPTISGTGDPGADVTVTDQDGNTLCTTTVAADGTWSCDSSALPEGPTTLTATQTDPTGNQSPESNAVVITVDTTAPDAPVITSPADGSTLADNTPTITGTGEPGATVTVKDENGDTLCTATVDGSGNWACESTVALPDGDHTLTATQTDPAGNTSPASDPVGITIDTTAPDAPVISTPADGSTTNDPTPPITGAGEPGATVTVTDENGTTLCTATVAGDGSWTCTPTTALADGDHTITATQTDPAGNTSVPSDPVTFTVDTAAPDAPLIVAPADGSTTADNTPLIIGTGEPGATVNVSIDGTAIGTATVGADGNWSLQTTTPLGDGDHTVSATQTDPAGNTSDPTSNDFTVDTTAPAPPVIQTPADGSSISDNTPTISGTAEPNSTVTVSVDGTQIGTVTADASGNWSIDTTTPLADGPHTVSATATDAVGNTSDAATNNFTVDTQAPDAPAITGPADGSTIGDSTPTITGTGEPGATVTVTDAAGATVCTATVDANGTWTCDPTVTFGDGDHTITATQTDAAGNQSAQSAPVTFTVDTTAPNPPVISTVDDQDAANPVATNDSTPTITGTGEAGDQLSITDSNGNTVCTATVATDGTWSCTPDTALADGTYTVTASQTDGAGNTSPDSNSAIFTIDTVAPDAPVITGPADGSTTRDTTPVISGTGEPGDTVTVLIDGTEVGTATVGDDGSWRLTTTTPLADGDHTITATQTDPAGNTSPESDPVTITVDTKAPDTPVIQTPVDGSSIADNTPTISGTAEPNSTVTVSVDGTQIGTVTADADGNWSIDTTTPLADGPHTVSATATDAAGNTSDPATNNFTVDTQAPDAPVITGPTDGSTVGDSTPTITGTGEPGDTVTVTDENGTTLCTTTVQDNDTWTCTPTTPLGDGDHTITATQTDPTGNESPASDPATFRVDTTAPDAPVITSPTSGTTTDDNTPTITGTGTPGDTVTVYDNGEPIGQTTVDDNGDWTFTPDQPLSDGDHTITATQTDPAGNESPSSDPVIISMDTEAPAEPTITSPADGSSTTDRTPTVTGTGEPGDTVTVWIDGTKIGTTTVNSDGTWSLPVTDPLAVGDHRVRATQTDPAGHVSKAAVSRFTVTTNAPVITSPQNGDNTGTKPTVKGTGTPGATIKVEVDGIQVGTTTVKPNGTWVVKVKHPLTCGRHTMTATQTVNARRTLARAVTSPTSAPIRFNVMCAGNTTPTSTPTSTSPSTQNLPNTGAPAGLVWMLALGLGCIAAGAQLVRRRRRS